MDLPFFWIDAFASKPFAGNPAGVVPLEGWAPDALMQRIAFENGLAETAFFVPAAAANRDVEAGARFQLRWFTPTAEVDLCGHATLAAGHVLLRELGVAADAVTFDSRSGPLIVARRDDKLELDFPATPVESEPDPTFALAVAAAIGAKPVWLGRSRFDAFVEVATADVVRTLKPDLAKIAALGGRGLIVTAAGDGTCDFVSRFFAPQVGVPEDPVTGSAHCALTPFWAARLGRTTLRAKQLSPRGGELWCEAVRAESGSTADRVKIAGHAVRYLRGTLSVPER